MKRLFFSILWVVITLVVFFLAIEISSFFSTYSVKSDYAYIRPSEIVLNSPVQSTVDSVTVKSSDKINAGDPLVVLNASHVDTEIHVIKSHIKSLKLKQDFLMSLIASFMASC